MSCPFKNHVGFGGNLPRLTCLSVLTKTLFWIIHVSKTNICWLKYTFSPVSKVYRYIKYAQINEKLPHLWLNWNTAQMFFVLGIKQCPPLPLYFSCKTKLFLTRLIEKCFDVILPTVRDVLQNFWWSHSNEHPLLLLQQMQTHFGLFLRLYNGTEPCQKAITKLKTCKMWRMFWQAHADGERSKGRGEGEFVQQ